jgi:hypothetical protein
MHGPWFFTNSSKNYAPKDAYPHITGKGGFRKPGSILSFQAGLNAALTWPPKGRAFGSIAVSPEGDRPSRD